MNKVFLKCFFLLYFIACISPIYAQIRAITGRVTAREDGSGLPGVSVRVKGTTVGTQTGPNGQFSINVPNNNAVLVFTYVGYTQQQVAVGTKSSITVALASDATQLGEVVVTALGVQRNRNELPYAAQQVGSELSGPTS